MAQESMMLIGCISPEGLINGSGKHDDDWLFLLEGVAVQESIVLIGYISPEGVTAQESIVLIGYYCRRG